MMIKLRIILPIIVLGVFFYSCSDDDKSAPVGEPDEPIVPSDEVITIPVVVHVVNYAPDPFEISDAKIKSQIDILNEDFRKKNSDHVKTPDEFKDLVADIGIEFRLATIDPNGNPTTGIIRSESDVIGGDGQDDIDAIEDRRLYFTDKGGQDAWPNSKYLNIWIADSSTRSGDLALAGYANPPGSDPRIDGVVMDPRVFGVLEPVYPGHHLGRTATHEIGHWLNLKHIWGEAGSCEIGDEVEDTPDQESRSPVTFVYPTISCGSNDMIMNFMDYVWDDAMYMFTKGQKERMRALFNEGGARRELYLNSKAK